MGRGLCAAGAGPSGVPSRLRGRPLEDLGWGKEEKNIAWGVRDVWTGRRRQDGRKGGVPCLFLLKDEF